MSKQRYVRDEMWSDEWFYNLGQLEKLVWIFLLTNERANIAGVYKINLAWAASMIGVEDKILEGVLKTFEGGRKLVLHEGWVVIVNFIKHQAENPSVGKGIARIVATLPESLLERVQAVHSEGTDCSTLLNYTLLNSTLLYSETEDSKKDTKKYTDDDLRMTELLIELIQKNNPDWKMRGNIDTWAEHIDKLHRIDGRTYQQIEYMIRWVQNDDFWQQNILSTSKLRAQFNNLIPKLKASAVKMHTAQQQARKPKVL